MDAFLGTFAVGDNIHTARLAPKTDDGEDWGDGMGTGWTAELEIHRVGVAAVLVTESGTAETVAEAAYLFVLGDIGLLAPAAGTYVAEYDAYLKLTKASSVYIGGPEGDVRTPFKFTIRDTSP